MTDYRSAAHRLRDAGKGRTQRDIQLESCATKIEKARDRLIELRTNRKDAVRFDTKRLRRVHALLVQAHTLAVEELAELRRYDEIAHADGYGE